MRYKVLWFDDEHASEHASHIFLKAEKAGIKLVGVATAEEGERVLKLEPHAWDAILLDGLFGEEENVAGATHDETALVRAIQAIKTHEQRHGIVLPWFVLSGQTSILDNNSVLRSQKVSEADVYDKNSDDDFDRLWIDIIHASDNRPTTRVRHRFRDVFEISKELGFETQEEEDLLKVLKDVSEKDSDLPDHHYLRFLRNCLERMFRACNVKGLLHDKCIKNGEVKLQLCSLFMAGEPVKTLGVRCRKAHFNPLVATHVRHLLEVTSAYSHTEGPEKGKARFQLEEYRKLVARSPYLLYSLTFMMMDVLLWYKAYSNLNSDVDKNKALWKTLDKDGWDRGEVVEMDKYGNAFFQSDTFSDKAFIHFRQVQQNGLSEGDPIEAVIRPLDERPKVAEVRRLKKDCSN
ncbi:MAG: hypothetical protein KDC02_24295 [Flavobacteriales bacterium]|nr:hypothetical protein [Flavobacteriales bacterium]